MGFCSRWGAKIFLDPPRTTVADACFDYGEERLITDGFIDKRLFSPMTPRLTPSGSFRPARPTPEKANAIGIVKYPIDPTNPPKTSQEASDRYDSLRQEDIDYSDIPDRGDVDWSLIRVEGPRVKPTVTLRLDLAVIQYIKHDVPKGYTGRMAAVLAAYVKAQTTKPELARNWWPLRHNLPNRAGLEQPLFPIPTAWL